MLWLLLLVSVGSPRSEASKVPSRFFQVKNHVSISWIFLKIQRETSVHPICNIKNNWSRDEASQCCVVFYQILFEWAILCKKVLSDVIQKILPPKSKLTKTDKEYIFFRNLTFVTLCIFCPYLWFIRVWLQFFFTSANLLYDF